MTPAGEAGSGPAGPAGDAPTFESLLAELEAVTDRLASGEVGIEMAAELYERAEDLHRQASERLDAVTARIERQREERAGPETR